MPATTGHQKLKDWVAHWAEILQPDAIEWCDGSQEEWDRHTALLVDGGTFTPLDPAKRPNSFLALSDPGDVARVEDRTFINSEREVDAGPTNNWRSPEDMKAELLDLYRGAMRGRTMYVVPFSMGPLGSPIAHVGVQLSDSAYVVVNMRIMTRMGQGVLDVLGDDGEFVPCVHSVGYPLVLADGTTRADVPWPCDADNKYITHYPETPARSGATAPATGATRSSARSASRLRIASTMARADGWMAEHMLVLGITNPEGEKTYVAAAFPSACGKTNMAMMIPTLPGWKVETIGDDIAWMKFGHDGRLRDQPGGRVLRRGARHRRGHQPERRAQPRRQLDLHQRRQDGRRRHLVGGPVGSAGDLTDWKGNDWSPGSDAPAAHPNARFTAPASQCPSIAPEWEDPKGVPISAILFGGRRATNVPLVTESFDWEHGVFLGSIMSSETTAAQAGTVGKLRFDPFAMLPFCGYNMGHYFRHWLEIGQREGAQLPKLFWVNWFRKGEDGKFLWPGFGENSRVLKWVVERCRDRGDAVDTPIGRVPASGAVDTTGLVITDPVMQELVAVDASSWRAELPQIEEHYAGIGPTLPDALTRQLAELDKRLSAS